MLETRNLLVKFVSLELYFVPECIHELSTKLPYMVIMCSILYNFYAIGLLRFVMPMCLDVMIWLTCECHLDDIGIGIGKIVELSHKLT